jgi:hypothetical protein
LRLQELFHFKQEDLPTDPWIEFSLLSRRLPATSDQNDPENALLNTWTRTSPSKESAMKQGVGWSTAIVAVVVASVGVTSQFGGKPAEKNGTAQQTNRQAPETGLTAHLADGGVASEANDLWNNLPVRHVAVNGQ